MKIRYLTGLIGLLAVMITPLSALPSQVIVLRHAEKPAEGNELSRKGFERASALASLLMGKPDFIKNWPPAALIAAGQKTPASSVRSIQTLEPLAQLLNLPVRTHFRSDQALEMVRFVMSNPAFQGQTVIIAWEHNSIPAMIQELGVNPGPLQWPRQVFDRFWAVTYRPDGSAVFQDLPQSLLFGDSLD